MSLQKIVTVTDHGHLIEVTGDDPDDRRYRVICPDGGKNCECWTECQESHPCDCGPHPHDSDCPALCDEDHSLECDEWLWRDGMMHGTFHQYVGSLLCIKDSGCWMPQWDIEFDQINYRELYPPGIYDFSYEQPDPDDFACPYILSMQRLP